jgi:ADP-heptose:LPS heptosyltransferase
VADKSKIIDHFGDIPADDRAPELLTERDKLYVDRYTVRERKVKEQPGQQPPLGQRIRRTVEGVNRRFWYRLFDRIFDNHPATERIPIDKLRSIFILPIGDAVGDMVVALPLYHAIKRHNPHCRIGTIVSSRNKTLIRCDSAVDRTYMFRNKDDVRHYPELFSARRDGYDVVVSMRMNHMTEFGIICNIIGPGAIKVSTSHARKDMYRVLFNKLLPLDRYGMHLSQLGLAMLESVIDFGKPLEQWESRPTITVPNSVREDIGLRVDSELKRLDADWFIHFNPQARNPTREWGLSNAFEFAERFIQHYPRGAIFFSASPVHRAAVEEKIKQLKLERVAFFPTSYDLLELAALAERSELIITPDTSAIHFGTASGKPTLTLWPDPNDLPRAWIPLQVPSINLAPQETGMLVPTISVDLVWNAAQRLLDKEWTATATSIGLMPEAAPLYQASSSDTSLAELIGH